MTTPITPPPELVQQWIEQGVSRPPGTGYMTCFANQAAQWGADQELEACCEWLAGWCRDEYPGGIGNLRVARRPKPPSLKEQALDELHISFDRCYLKKGSADTIRRALEALPDD
jgi:hypothetical protein